MAAAVFNPNSLFAIVAVILGLSGLCFTEAQKGGFSVELIHRDSLKSPLYNALETPSDRVTNALRRSFNRVHRFRPSSISTMAVEADPTADAGEYLMNISIGTPAFDIVALADTGSDLIWTQCKPCPRCYPQENPLFNPRDSSTYRPISCSANSCVNLMEPYVPAITLASIRSLMAITTQLVNLLLIRSPCLRQPVAP